MHISKRFLIAASTLAASIAGCGGAASSGSSGAPALDEAAYAGPIASTDVAAGADAFEMYCSGCHPGGEASRSGPTIAALQLTPGRVRMQVRQGGAHMPDFGPEEIDDASLEALLAHLTTFGTVAQE